MESQPMPCPACGADLEAATGRHGIVWLCRSCRAGAATLPILRLVAPRDFVNQLWQAALHNGVESSRICPSCTRPFTSFTGSRARVEPKLEVCTRCYWVWLGSESLKVLSQLHPTPPVLRLPPGSQPFSTAPATSGDGRARDVLMQLAADVVLEVLP